MTEAIVIDRNKIVKEEMSGLVGPKPEAMLGGRRFVKRKPVCRG